MITDMKNSKLFSPLKLGKTTLKNRVAMAPMSMDYEAADGTVPPEYSFRVSTFTLAVTVSH